MTTPKLYTLEYLLNEELTDEDLVNILYKKSFNYSIIYNMFKFIDKEEDESILYNKIIKDNTWLNTYHFTKRQYNKYKDILAQIYKNIYQVGIKTAYINADNWLMFYGFKIK